RAMIENREGAAWHHDRHTIQETLIQNLRLRHVGELGRTADVSDRGEQIILNNRTQERVAGELLGAIYKLGDAVDAILGDVVAILAPQRHPAILIEQEEERCLRFDVYLRVVAR